MQNLELSSFQETLNMGMCGPASLKIVLSYYGLDKSEQELAKAIGVTEIGSTAEGIAKAAEILGFNVYIKNESSLDEIFEWLNKKVPVIVNWFTRGRSDYSDSEVADGHYSVVQGLDDDFIYLQDPEIGNLRKIARNDFLRVWFDFKGRYIQPDELIIRQLIAIYPKV